MFNKILTLFSFLNVFAHPNIKTFLLKALHEAIEPAADHWKVFFGYCLGAIAITVVIGLVSKFVIPLIILIALGIYGYHVWKNIHTQVHTPTQS